MDCSRENLSVRGLRVLIKDVLDEHKIKGQHLIRQKVPASYVVINYLISVGENAPCTIWRQCEL